MRQLGTLLCVLILASACGGSSTLPSGPSPVPTPTQPPPLPPTPPLSPPEGRVISIGEEVNDTLTFNGAEKVFELTAPSDGTLVIRLSWEPSQGRLELELADTRFAHFPENWSPIVGNLPVLVGGTYRVTVTDGAPWDYGGLFLPFVLTTSIE
jgi:hypothetical protein